MKTLINFAKALLLASLITAGIQDYAQCYITPILTGSTSACVNTTSIYIAPGGMNNYIWTVNPNGTIMMGGGSGDSVVYVYWDTPGTQALCVNYTDSNGCTGLTPTCLNVTVNPLPVPTITGSQTVCVNSPGNVYTTELGMTNYIWSFSAGGTITAGGTATDNTMIVTWNVAGARFVKVNYTDGNSCTATSATVYNVTVNSLPVLTITGTNVLCFGAFTGAADLTVSGGTPGYTYNWSNGVTTEDITGISANVYSVTVSDANGCTTTDAVVITQPSVPITVTFTTTNASCLSSADGTASIIVTGGTPPYMYYWNTGITTQTAIGLIPGTYTVCVTDANGCSTCDSVTIGVGSCSASFNLYPDTAQPHHYFAMNMATGVPPLTYLWNWDDGTTDTIALPRHTYSNAGFYTICLTIADSVGCTSTFCDSSYNIQKGGNTVITVDVIPAAFVGITEIAGESYIRIFPNPADDLLTIIFSKAAVKAEIEILNIQGKVIKNIPAAGSKINLNISMLSSGMYFIKIKTETSVMMSKFVKE